MFISSTIGGGELFFKKQLEEANCRYYERDIRKMSS